jgi:hypothetical protein
VQSSDDIQHWQRVVVALRDQNQLDEVGAFLRALPDEKWAHFGEI